MPVGTGLGMQLMGIENLHADQIANLTLMEQIIQLFYRRDKTNGKHRADLNLVACNDAFQFFEGFPVHRERLIAHHMDTVLLAQQDHVNTLKTGRESTCSLNSAGDYFLGSFQKRNAVALAELFCIIGTVGPNCRKGVSCSYHLRTETVYMSVCGTQNTKFHFAASLNAPIHERPTTDRSISFYHSV